MKTKVITHRGLDPSRQNYFAESSAQAFDDQLTRNFGLEFDVQFTKDLQMIAVHDPHLARLTGGKDTRKIQDVSAKEVLALELPQNSRLTTIPHLLQMIEALGAHGSISALHLKYLWQQNIDFIDILIAALRESKISPEKYIIFDVLPHLARHLKFHLPEAQLAASVSHPHDIHRYSSAVGGTLLTVEDVILHHDLYSWAWLDEWDRTDEGGKDKTLYNEETFDLLRKAGLRIALVTPELHGTSPALLGGESHPDDASFDILDARLRQIIALRPDAICTDYPDHCRQLINEIQGK